MLCIGEDEKSFARHINTALSTESLKSKPNLQLVEELMNLLYKMRRVDILDNPCDLLSLFEKYPFLKNEEQVNS